MSLLFVCTYTVQSPHLRAKFGQVLFQVFLPVAERSHEELWSSSPSVDGPHTALLGNHLEAQQFLAPALLLLYGDVERTGFYEKLTNRRAIMVVLKHLWTLPTHRPAFRGIAIANSTAALDDEIRQGYFVRFANGLLNETNGEIIAFDYFFFSHICLPFLVFDRLSFGGDHDGQIGGDKESPSAHAECF